MQRFKLWALTNPQATKEQFQFASKIVHGLTEMLMNLCGNLYFKIFKRLTQWDKNRLAFLQAFIVSIRKLLRQDMHFHLFFLHLNFQLSPGKYHHQTKKIERIVDRNQ